MDKDGVLDDCDFLLALAQESYEEERAPRKGSGSYTHPASYSRAPAAANSGANADS